LELPALMMSFLAKAPALAVALSYMGLVLYWYLRVVARRTGSYRALAELQGPPSATEQGIWIALLVAGAACVVAASCATTRDYRTLSTFSLRPGASPEVSRFTSPEGE
jgi:hypothetical protein